MSEARAPKRSRRADLAGSETARSMSLATMSSVPPEVKAPVNTERGMLSKVRLWPALTGTIAARTATIDAGLGRRPMPSRAGMNWYKPRYACQLGGAARPARPDMENIAGDPSKSGPSRVNRFLANRHYGHVGRGGR